MLSAIIEAVAGIIVTKIGKFWTSSSTSASPITVKRIKNPENSKDHVDLLMALDLYKNRIPEDELCSTEDTVRWLKETYQANKKGNLRVQDFFLIAKYENKICGLIYFTYYPESKLAFISYLVSNDEVSEATRFGATAQIIGEVRKLLNKELKGCEGFVTEVDRITYIKIKRGKKKPQDAKGKIDHFCTLSKMHGFDLKPLHDVAYIQPALSPDSDGSDQKPLLLMYARTGNGQSSADLTPEELGKILNFVYEEIYGDCFMDDEEQDKKYRGYLAGLSERVLKDYTNKKKSTTP